MSRVEAEYAWLRLLGLALLGLSFVAVYVSPASLAAAVMGAALYSLGFSSDSRGGLYARATLSAALWAAAAIALGYEARHELGLAILPGEQLQPLPLIYKLALIASVALFVFSSMLVKPRGLIAFRRLEYFLLVAGAAGLALSLLDTRFIYFGLLLALPPLLESIGLRNRIR